MDTGLPPYLVVLSESAIKCATIHKALKDSFQIKEVDSSKDLFETLQFGKIDFLIIDDKTPGIKVLDILKRFRIIPGQEETPVIVITSKLKKSSTQQLIKAGATDFLREPFDEDAISHRVEMTSRYQTTHEKMGKLSTFLQHSTPNATPKTLEKRLVVDDRSLKAISKAKDKKHNLSVLMVEIDQWDKITSKDKLPSIVKNLEGHIKKFIRKQDIINAIGKGKFLIVLPKTSQTAAHIFAENIQEGLKEHHVLKSVDGLNLTLSIGLVDITDTKEVEKNLLLTVDDLLDKATSCLNTAKIRGNKIISVKKSKENP